ncbi:MAG TPA: type VII secretion integral membrane protein EccD [Trebonia sp.]|jgi:type VII secretion integral membrane protein EccD|nr:type VII secretion integral membrane protein EccD [Trebonia sp.]
MSPAITSDTCRVTVVAPRRRVDIALPSGVPFADLFPAVARFCGLDHTDLVREPGGWVLQRLGEAPLRMSGTPASEGLTDGDLVYLRPKSVELPPQISDDIADEISGVHAGAGRWKPADAGRLGVGAGAVGLFAGAVLVARSGPHWTVPALAAGVIAVVLLAAATAASRAWGNALLATMLGCASLPYAFVAGAAAVAAGAAGTGTGTATGLPFTHTGLEALGLPPIGALGLLTGFALVLLAAVVAAAGVASGVPAFFGIAAAALLGVGAAGIAYGDPSVTAEGAAALIAIPALAIAPLIPWTAFRIAGIALPRMPVTPDDLRDDSLTAIQADIRPRTAVADRAVTGAVCGIGLVGAGALLTLGFGHGMVTAVTAAVLACAMLLQSRLFRGRAQRLWLLVPGYTGLAWLALTSQHLPAVAGLVAGSLLVAWTGSWLPSNRPSPFWGRAADIADMACVVALIPLALGVAGVLSYLHGLNG